jgi:2-(1,2-epoxy-1,2-dihydrophenyl)acetyl-CoA isomerase
MAEDFIAAIDGPIATFTLNRPQSRNALSDEMMRGMAAFLTKIEHDPAVRCMVLTGAGEHFQSGGDIKGFAQDFAKTPPERRAAFEARIHQLHLAMYAMRRMRKPIVASVRGACAGFGVSLALNCDLVIAADNTYFTLAYINIGTSPDGGSSYYLPRAVGMKKAMEIAFLGDRFDAPTAQQWGMINYVVPLAQLMAETDKLARRLAAQPTHAIGNTKRLMNDSLHNQFEAQLQAEALSFADCTTTDDMREGVTAFIQKRKPDFKGK